MSKTNITINDKTWLIDRRAFEATKSEADAISYAALALMIDKDYPTAAKAIIEMAKLYAAVYSQRVQDITAWAYNREGFDKKVKQIIAIAINETGELEMKKILNSHLERYRKQSSIILL